MGMSLIVEQAIYEIKLLTDNVSDGKHIVTGDIRKLSARLYREIKDKTTNENCFFMIFVLLVILCKIKAANPTISPPPIKPIINHNHISEDVITDCPWITTKILTKSKKSS